jgi:hypothetical protein
MKHMEPGAAALAAMIAAHLADWERPFVELAIHGTADAHSIAAAIDSFCLRELGAAVAEPLFYRSSIGAVAGVCLTDGRRVVIKAHQPAQPALHLQQAAILQRYLAATEAIAAAVIAAPSPLGAGTATAEEFCVRGESRDGHQPDVRKALAAGLHRVIRALAACGNPAGLRSNDPPADALWPVPHSRLFDFEATARGAEYIDELAREARRRMVPAGARVISHGDWRAEHVRFEGERISIAYDWDSLCTTWEPAAVGAAAHMFCADWSCDDVAPAPTLDEAIAFVGDYEAERGEPFTSEERRLCGAAFGYAVAYTARCGHAAGVDIRDRPGNHQHLIHRHRTALLDLRSPAR